LPNQPLWMKALWEEVMGRKVLIKWYKITRDSFRHRIVHDSESNHLRSTMLTKMVYLIQVVRPEQEILCCSNARN
jgi:hypothetical protein